MTTSPRRFALLPTFALVMAVFGSTPARAAPRPRVAVLEILIEGDAAPEMRGQLDKSLSGGLYAAGWEVVAREDVAKKLKGSPELIGCVTTTCLEEIGEMVGTSRFVRVRITAAGATYTIEIELFAADVATGPIARLEKACAPCTFDEANELMSEAARQLREGAGDRVLVRVASDPPGAVIELDGVALGVAPLETEVLPGDHVFRAKLAGRADALMTTSIEVQRGGAAQVVALTLPPPESVPDGGGAGAGGDHGDDGSDAQRPYKMWKWAATGGAAIALVSGIVLLSMDGDGIGCPPGPGQCPDHYETTAGGAALTLTGAALGGVATWMFLKDRPQADAATVGARPTSGGALVYWRRSF